MRDIRIASTISGYTRSSKPTYREKRDKIRERIRFQVKVINARNYLFDRGIRRSEYLRPWQQN